MKSDIDKIKDYISKNMRDLAEPGNDFKDGYCLGDHCKSAEILAFIEGLQWKSDDCCVKGKAEEKSDSDLCSCGHSRSYHNSVQGCCFPDCNCVYFSPSEFSIKDQIPVMPDDNS